MRILLKYERWEYFFSSIRCFPYHFALVVVIPEQWHLNEILGPPHGCRIHQIPSENSSPTKSQYLRSNNDNQRHPITQLLLVEQFNGANHVNRVRVTGAGISEDRDKHVLFHVEWARIQCKFPLASFEENSVRDAPGHEVP